MISRLYTYLVDLRCQGAEAKVPESRRAICKWCQTDLVQQPINGSCCEEPYGVRNAAGD
jgi:hypothetical protein